MTSYIVWLPNHHEKLPIFLSVTVHKLYINLETKTLPTIACLPVTAQLIHNIDVQYRSHQNISRVNSPKTWSSAACKEWKDFIVIEITMTWRVLVYLMKLLVYSFTFLGSFFYLLVNYLHNKFLLKIEMDQTYSVNYWLILST